MFLTLYSTYFTSFVITLVIISIQMRIKANDKYIVECYNLNINYST